jgi:hypothetical protein
MRWCSAGRGRRRTRGRCGASSAVAGSAPMIFALNSSGPVTLVRPTRSCLTLFQTHTQRALRGLIHAFPQARDAGQAQIAPLIRDPLISSLRHAVRVGLSDVRPIPGPRGSTASRPVGSCWSSAETAKATSCGSPPTSGSGPRTTSANADCARSRPSRRSPVGSRAKRPPRTAWISAVHRHHPQARSRRPGWHPRRSHRCPVAATDSRADPTVAPRPRRPISRTQPVLGLPRSRDVWLRGVVGRRV